MLKYWILFGYTVNNIIKSILMRTMKTFPPHEFRQISVKQLWLHCLSLPHYFFAATPHWLNRLCMRTCRWVNKILWVVNSVMCVLSSWNGLYTSVSPPLITINNTAWTDVWLGVKFAHPSCLLQWGKTFLLSALSHQIPSDPRPSSLCDTFVDQTWTHQSPLLPLVLLFLPGGQWNIGHIHLVWSCTSLQQ